MQKRKFFYWLTISNFLYIIVLLILAGVTIAALSGDNGILQNAARAKEETEAATLEEKIKLLAAETLINKYTGENKEKTAQELQDELNNQGENVLVVQWDKYIIFDLDKNEEYRVMSDGSVEYWGESTMGTTLLNTKTANQDQLEQNSSTSNVIGIDNDGNTVNMLLWEYTLINNSGLGKIGTYGLNDENGLDASGASGRSAGYIGDYTENGQIIGTVPAYISTDEGNTYVSVTSMVHTFYDCGELIIAPEIAETVTNMGVTFYQASNLTNAPDEIPDSVITLDYTFLNCIKLNTVPTLGKNVETMVQTFRNTAMSEFNVNLPNSLINLDSTFQNCTSLVAFNSTIPDSVTNMSSAFYDCTSLISFSSIIPNTVVNMNSTFFNCKSLEEGPTTISDNVINMQSTFYNCTLLKTVPSIIPSTVINMFQTFGGCNNLTGKIQINANLSGKIVANWNGTDLKDYEQCFSNASTVGEGLIISKDSTCPELENLINTKSSNSNITLEE